MRKIAKFIIVGVFLFILVYANRDRIPVPAELIVSGQDIISPAQ